MSEVMETRTVKFWMIKAPLAIFVLLPLYFIGACASVIWISLQIGYQIGEEWMFKLSGAKK